MDRWSIISGLSCLISSRSWQKTMMMSDVLARFVRLFIRPTVKTFPTINCALCGATLHYVNSHHTEDNKQDGFSDGIVVICYACDTPSRVLNDGSTRQSSRATIVFEFDGVSR